MELEHVTDENRSRNRGVAIARLLYLWLVIGFALGTVVLVGPTRWITGWTRENGMGGRAESMIMWAVMAAFVVGSFLIARWAARRLSAAHSPAVRIGTPAILTLAAGAALWAWMSPARLAGAAGTTQGTVTVASGAEFVFGPYADYHKIKELKEQGFSGIISLQHPAVLPFEPPGIKASREATADLGVRFIHAPMVPWVSDNEGSLDLIRRVAAADTGKFYVHCGLGRDRTNVVKRMLESEGVRTHAAEGIKAPRSFAVKKATMERGRHREIERDVWLVPYPNKHEFFGNMFAGQVSHVVSLLDPARSGERAWIDESAGLFTKYKMPYTHLPLTAGDTRRALDIVRDVRSRPRPVVVIAPYTPPYASGTEIAETFASAYRTVCRAEKCAPVPKREVHDP